MYETEIMFLHGPQTHLCIFQHTEEAGISTSLVGRTAISTQE